MEAQMKKIVSGLLFLSLLTSSFCALAMIRREEAHSREQAYNDASTEGVYALIRREEEEAPPREPEELSLGDYEDCFSRCDYSKITLLVKKLEKMLIKGETKNLKQLLHLQTTESITESSPQDAIRRIFVDYVNYFEKKMAKNSLFSCKNMTIFGCTATGIFGFIALLIKYSSQIGSERLITALVSSLFTGAKVLECLYNTKNTYLRTAENLSNTRQQEEEDAELKELRLRLKRAICIATQRPPYGERKVEMATCGHRFHRKRIHAYLVTQKNSRCPKCRKNLRRYKERLIRIQKQSKKQD